VDLGRHPQMGAGGHWERGVHLKRHRRWVSVKTVRSKATSPRQHVSGADRFISAVFQATSSRGGSPWRWRAIPISASEPVVQFPSLFYGSGSGGHRVSVVGLGRHPQMGAGGHREWSVHPTRHRGWVSVKIVPSKATPSRQHISGADRFISAVFQAVSFRGGSPCRWAVHKYKKEGLCVINFCLSFSH